MGYDEPLFQRVMAYAAQADRDVVGMVSGSPDWEPPSALREGLRAYADGDPADFRYTQSEGLRALRAEIADRRNVDPDQVLVTAGTAEANHVALGAALDRADGEQVVIPDPAYPYYPARAELLGGTPVRVPVAPDGSLDPCAVRAATSDDTAAVLVNTPNNPTGAVYDAATMREFVAAAEDADAVLLADEVYDHFDLGGSFASALGVDSGHRVVASGFSKSLAVTGFRVGYAVFGSDAPGPALFDRASTRHTLTTIAASRPAQRAVLSALQDTDPDYYADARGRLRDRVATFTDALDHVGAAYTEPGGGFYVLARFPDLPGSLQNAERLIDEAGVAAMPGAAFGEARADWFRFALVTPRVETAAERIEAFFGDD